MVLIRIDAYAERMPGRLGDLVEFAHLVPHSAHDFAIVAEKRANRATNRNEIHYKWLDVAAGSIESIGPPSLLRLRGEQLVPKPNGNEEILPPVWSPSGVGAVVHRIIESREDVVLLIRNSQGDVEEKVIFRSPGNITRVVWADDEGVRVDERVCISENDETSRRSMLLTPEYVPYLHGISSQQAVCASWYSQSTLVSVGGVDLSGSPVEQLGTAEAELTSMANSGRVPPTRTVSFRRSVDSTVWKICEHGACKRDIKEVWLDAAYPRALFLAPSGGNKQRQSLHAWDPNSNHLEVLTDDERRFHSCGQSRSHNVCVVETPKTPPRIVKFKTTDRLDTVYEPNVDWFGSDSPRVEPLEWSDGHGNIAAGHLVYPAMHDPNKRYPLVVVQYRSRGFLRGGTGGEYPIFRLAAHGFFILSFDRPDDHNLVATAVGSDDLVRLEWQNLYKRKRILDALEVQLSELVGRGLVDRTRIAITGLSNGADTVNYALINSEYFSSAIVSGGLWSQSSYFLMSEKAREVNATRGFGRHGATKERTGS